MSLRDAPIEAVMNNIADIIEGGNAYRAAGTAYKGLATVQPSRRTSAYPTVTATAIGTTTTVIDTVRTEPSNFWAKTKGVPLYLYCTSGTSGNIYRWRKITGWNATTGTFTTSAWPGATAASDVFAIREGFKYVQSDIDIFDEAGDQDRVFDVIIGGAGQTIQSLQRFGEAHIEYQIGVTVRVRYDVQDRAHRTNQRIHEDVILIVNALTDGNNRDATVVIDLCTFLGHNISQVQDQDSVISSIGFAVKCKTRTREG